MNKKIALLLVIILIIITIVISSKNIDNTPIRIVALYPLTGGVASWGEASQKATQIAVEEINSNG